MDKKENNWISVNDELPEPNILVEVRLGCTSMEGFTISESIRSAMLKDNGRWTAGFDWCKVALWRPLNPQSV